MNHASIPPRHRGPSLFRGTARLACAASLALCLNSVQADEGMWTFEHAPVAQVRERYGVNLTPEWLAALRGASVNYGASASFVSERGLLLTNHHVALRCIDHISSAARDIASTGFVAATQADEIRCPGDSARVLVSNEDVTATIVAASAQAGSSEARNQQRKAAMGQVESACATTTGLRCEVVTLYSGAMYQLYRYQEWDDVRLVFAPEYQAAFFGGDPDNFVFPRFALDAALFRVYDKTGQPVHPTHHLRLASTPAKEGDVVFSAGHPGNTDRLLTVAQLTALRDVWLPLQISSARSQQAMLQAYSKRSPEAARQALDMLFGTENWLKATLGELGALKQPELLARKAEDEARFQAAYAKQGLAGNPWQDIAAATARQTAKAHEKWAVGYGYKTLFAMAGDLVAQAYERQKPPGERMLAYRDSALPQLDNRLKALVPFYKELEVARLANVLDQARQLLPADHAYLRASLAGASPQAAAERWLRASHLDDAAVRQQLLSGGVAAIEASTDPLIQLARQVYPLRRALERAEEEQVDTPVQLAAQALGQARFTLNGHAVPPDATRTLRLTYGRVAGYTSNGHATPWKTTWGGWLARADSFDQRPPFNLPERIAGSRNAVDPRTPLNMVSTLESIGGSSGSPVVNQHGELVGLIFDSNLEALGGSYGYSEETARSIAVHTDAIVAALDKVYGAPALAGEMRQGR